MELASSPPSSDWSRGSLRRRTAAFVLVAVVHILLIVMLLTLAPQQSRVTPPPELRTFRLLPVIEQRIAPKPLSSGHKPHATRSAGGAPPNPARHVSPPPNAPPAPLNMMIVTKDVFAATDISKLPSHEEAKADGGTGTGVGAASGDAVAVGEGPGGAPLYGGDWYPLPTDAELATYMPHSALPPGWWGAIACKTIPNNHVEDCHELAESPTGSGLARGLRQAAWQFHVKPPRVGGRPLIGVWVYLVSCDLDSPPKNCPRNKHTK